VTKREYAVMWVAYKISLFLAAVFRVRKRTPREWADIWAWVADRTESVGDVTKLP